MSRFHINPKTGEPGSCRVTTGKCPFGSVDEHYATAEEARTAFESMNESFSLSQHIHISEAAEAALVSDLQWSGKTPRWMKANSKLQEKTFGTTPEIIAVIPSPVGKLAVVWEVDSVASNDIHVQTERGYEVSRITFNKLETGEEVGYLKMGSITEESFKRSFGDDEWSTFAWAEDALGGQYGYSNYAKDQKGHYVKKPSVRNLTGADKIEAKKNIWVNSHSSLHINPPDFDMSQLTWGSLVNLKASHAPEDEARLDREIASLREVLDKKLDARKAWHSEPMIDFIVMDNELRGKGMGHALYIFGARMQAKRDKVLRASGLQTPEAEKSWSLMKKFGLPISVMTKPESDEPNEKKTASYFALDFRK